MPRQLPPTRKTERSAPRTTRQTDLGALLQKIDRILTTDDASFRGLADAAGLDPKRDFQGIYLNGVPLSDQDVTGFDFSGSDLRNTDIQTAKRDRTTIFNSAIFDGPSLDPKVIALNKRLRDSPFHEIERKLAELLNGGERLFDVISFTTAIRRAPNAVKAARRYEEMQKAGVAPDVFTFSTLIGKAADEKGAARWYEEMQKAGVAPDVTTFNTLINKAADEKGAARRYEEMQKAGVAPDEITRVVLAKKGIAI